MATNLLMYRSYLLRLCQTTGTLRVTLVNVHDPADQHHFMHIDDLYLFLHRHQPFAPTEDRPTADHAKQQDLSGNC